ncbi:hypothetical protein HMPREF1870_01746 [Bacteroidales bacterium KA00344]|nr:hypothetical protein HMPREF1870_01746 [Bacteroidales bacterium KA00344]
MKYKYVQTMRKMDIICMIINIIVMKLFDCVFLFLDYPALVDISLVRAIFLANIGSEIL